jgi:hypothetical protein
MLNLADMISVPVRDLTLGQLNYIVTLLEYADMPKRGEPVKQWAIAHVRNGETPPHDYTGGELKSAAGISTIYCTDYQGNPYWGAVRHSNGRAVPSNFVITDAVWQARGSTELEAAMRCYVESTLGDIVNIPREVI